MKLGIFGGTFNPVHNGHIQNAVFIKDSLKLDRILFIPVKAPVHKKLDGNVSPKQRLEMLELALAEYDSLSPEPMELERAEPSYTIYTLQALRGKYPAADFYLILGADAFNSIDTWLCSDDIVSSVMLVIIGRNGDEELRPDLLHRITWLIKAENVLIDISSSLVRQRIRDGEDISSLVPPAVAGYIKERGLYLN